jgi:hypothetical protein
MTINEVRARVAKIESVKHDDEVAHDLEDALHLEVLEAIARGSKNAKALAVEALKSRTIEFQRWTA